MKHIFAAAVVAGDILAGIDARQVFAGLHKETAAHQLGTVGFYAVLALLTLWALASLLRTARGGTGTPAPRQFGPYRAPGRRR